MCNVTPFFPQFYLRVQLELLNESAINNNKLVHDTFYFLYYSKNAIISLKKWFAIHAYIYRLQIAVNSIKSGSQLTRAVAKHFLSPISSLNWIGQCVCACVRVMCVCLCIWARACVCKWMCVYASSYELRNYNLGLGLYVLTCRYE